MFHTVICDLRAMQGGGGVEPMAAVSEAAMRAGSSQRSRWRPWHPDGYATYGDATDSASASVQDLLWTSRAFGVHQRPHGLEQNPTRQGALPPPFGYVELIA